MADTTMTDATMNVLMMKYPDFFVCDESHLVVDVITTNLSMFRLTNGGGYYVTIYSTTTTSVVYFKSLHNAIEYAIWYDSNDSPPIKRFESTQELMIFVDKWLCGRKNLDNYVLRITHYIK
jgi:hypothetical protein